MTKSKIFFWLSVCFIFGIAIASFYYPRSINLELIYFLFLFVVGGICVFWKNKKYRLIGFVTAFFLLGVLLTAMKLEEIKKLDAKKDIFLGNVSVVKEPTIRGEMQNIIARINSSSNYFLKGKKILIRTSFFPEYVYGDELEIECDIQIPKNIYTSFDYRMYLAKDEIFYLCQNPKIEKISTKQEKGMYIFLLNIKNKFNKNINRLIPVPESGLLSGLILGGSDQLPEDVKDNFSKTGMTHIVAVSGYNVTIIAEYLMVVGIFLGLWRRQAFWFALCGIIIFIIITGAGASIVRAGIMGTLLVWAAINGRLANSGNAILFAADLMLLSNPLLLRFDIGFQLSFLATLGIIYLYPIMDNYLMKKNKLFGLSEILFLTLSAQIFVLPVILFNFNQLSVISPLANLLILPIIPLTMFFGFLVIIFSFIFYPLAIIFSWITYLLLKYETAIIEYLASLKFASIELKLSWQGVVFWYAILFMGMYFLKKRTGNNCEIKHCEN